MNNKLQLINAFSLKIKPLMQMQDEAIFKLNDKIGSVALRDFYTHLVLMVIINSFRVQNIFFFKQFRALKNLFKENSSESEQKFENSSELFSTIF
jgi:hypothetical protein